MKNILFIIVFVFLLNLVNAKAFADTSVNIQDNGNGASSDVQIDNSVGQSTTCVNGHCSTKGNGNNPATVCINGNCTTSPDGNIDKQEDGATVHIQNHNTNPSTQSTTSPEPTQFDTVTPLPTDIPTTSPSVRQKSEKNPPNQQLQSQSTGIEGLMNNISKFFSDLFSPNK